MKISEKTASVIYAVSWLITFLLVIYIIVLASGCTPQVNPTKEADAMLGKTEMEIKMKYSYPDQAFQDGEYRVLVYPRRLYTNLGPYGSIDKWEYTIFWLKNDYCTNWLIKQDVIAPDQFTIRNFTR